MRSWHPTLFRFRACRWRCAATFACLVMALAPLGGCGGAAVDDHAHDHAHEHHHDEEEHELTEADVEMPQNFAAAVARLSDYAGQIAKAIDSGDEEAAHRPLDEADIVLSKLMYIARDDGVPRTAWEEINVARRDLRAQFDSLHEAIDHGEKPPLATARPVIDAALAHMRSAAAHGGEPRVADMPERESKASEEKKP